MIHICPRSTPVCRAESSHALEDLRRQLEARLVCPMSIPPPLSATCRYYPALFATFPVDKQRITIVKLSSGAPGTMTTAMERCRVVGGFSDGANTLPW